MIFFKKHWFLLFLSTITILTRVALFNPSAQQFWADERHYAQLLSQLKEAERVSNYKIAYQTIFRLNARPALGLFYFPAAILEWKNSSIPFGIYFNFIVNFLCLLLVFLIAKEMVNKVAAFLSVCIITLTISSVIYLRHLLSYDMALLMVLISGYVYLKYKNFFISGIFIGLSFLTYPGYYYYFIPIPFLIAINYKSIKKLIIFSLGIGVVLILTQLAYIIAGETTPYFQSVMIEGSGGATSNYGDFIPAFSYISDYVYSLDGAWGIVLLVIILPGIFVVKNKKLSYFFTYILAVFFLLELYSHILQKNVLFGRTIRPLYLSTLVLSALIIERFFSKFSKKIYIFAIVLVIAISVINWFPRFTLYKDLVYPKQFQEKSRQYLLRNHPTANVEEAIFVNYWATKEEVPEHFFKPEKGEKDKFYITNAVQMFPYYGNYDLNDFCEHEVVLKEAHIQYLFKPYLFEAHKKVMREKMKQDPLYYQLILCK